MSRNQSREEIEREAGHLIDLALRAAHGSGSYRDYTAGLRSAPIEALVHAVGGIAGAQGTTGEHLHANREAMRAEIEMRLTDRLIAQTRRLEHVGIFVGIAGLILAGVQVWQGFGGSGPQ